MSRIAVKGIKWLTVERFYATAAAPAVKKRSPLNDEEQKDLSEEWKAAKPFDQIPGHKVLPFIGSTWALFPVVGNETRLRNSKATSQNYSIAFRCGD